MSRYRGPRFKQIRRLGVLPGLTSKRPAAIVGSELRNQSRSSKKSQYRIRLEEKQKLRFHYGLTEQQLLKYVRIAGKAKVNGRMVNIPSYRCKPQDIITTKDEPKSRALIQNDLDSAPRDELPAHLTLHPFQYKGLVNQIIDNKWVGLKINELLVVEYYSRQA
ncbi:hypothetical protein Lal_00033212 [Lupinus albus]|nr:hypothetical protein Lal_00033212 [Lupinus albus]